MHLCVLLSLLHERSMYRSALPLDVSLMQRLLNCVIDALHECKACIQASPAMDMPCFLLCFVLFASFLLLEFK